MKRWIIVLLVLCLFIPAIALGEAKKDEGPIDIVMVHGFGDYYKFIWDRFEAEHPEAQVVYVPKGSGVVAVDVLLAAKEPPNLFFSTPGGVGKFLIPGFALALNEENIPEIGQFKEGALDPYIRDGKVYALPVTVAVNAFAINLTLAEKVGFDVPDRDYLTIDEFVTFSKLIKDSGIPDTFGTAIWAANTGSQGVTFQWFASFGATFFENSDYTKTTINSPEGLQALKFMKYMLDEGFIPPEAGVLDDDEGLALFARGEQGGQWMRAGGMLTMITNAVKQGMLDEPFDLVFMTWPSNFNNGVPMTSGGNTGMVIDSGDDQINALSCRLLELMTGPDAQSKTIAPGAGYVTRYDALEPPQDPWPESVPLNMEVYEASKLYDPGFKHYTKISDLYGKYGSYDIGASTPYAGAIATAWLTVVQPYFAGDISAEDALADFEAKINKIVSGE
jgi:ABC-type glycerol-3-phosphate transport system substrate-binding protein